MKVLVVTGTSTGVGKTVATAALAATATGSVLVVKPVQTGALDGDSDAREVARLTGVEAVEWTTLDEPLAPDTAARRQGVDVPAVASYAARIAVLTQDTVIVEGAGGLLVRLDAGGGTLLDLASLLAGVAEVEVVVVVAAGLGTLNHTELTVDALRARGLTVRGLVIGAWPAEPDLAERCNLDDLQRIAPLLAVIPEGAGALDRDAFVAAAPGWFGAGDYAAAAHDDVRGAALRDHVGAEVADHHGGAARRRALPRHPHERRATGHHRAAELLELPVLLLVRHHRATVGVPRPLGRHERDRHPDQPHPTGVRVDPPDVEGERGGDLAGDHRGPDEVGGVRAGVTCHLGCERVADVGDLHEVVLRRGAGDRSAVAEPLELVGLRGRGPGAEVGGQVGARDGRALRRAVSDRHERRSATSRRRRWRARPAPRRAQARATWRREQAPVSRRPP